MRLVSLSVRNFQCIESADLEFGPGLNVLFGPNDLGKSSLAWAIRAVLLLQHNSAEHARFVSWYGSGDPTVTLTLLDDEERFWRVKKCFSKTASLESSKDGRDFRSEASARQTDDKLRELLRWGLHRPGGRGKPSGMSRSFLTQVLLSDQDDVRQILREATLEDDPDQDGRARLTKALGALAQDPLFKRVLDRAQAAVDRAFTATGQRKRAAGSPFVAVADKVKELAREKDELETRLRESIGAEERVGRLVSERDDLERALAEARGALEQAERQLETRRVRDQVVTAIGTHTAFLEANAAIERRIAARRDEVRDLEADLASEGGLIRATQEEVAKAEQDLARARERLDSLSQDDPATSRERLALEEQEREQIEAVHTASGDVERAEMALRAATGAARVLREAADGVAPVEALAREAGGAAERARDREGRARAALEAARQRLRELTSGDHAHTVELERKEVENRRLVAGAKLADIERTAARAREVGEVVARAAIARASWQSQLDAVNQRGTRLQELERSRERLEREIAQVQTLLVYAQLLALRRTEDAEARSRRAAAESRAAAQELRQEARSIRARVPDGLPGADAIDELRRLSEELRVAEARLGAVTVTVRPRRPLTLRASRDGVAEPPRVVSDPLALAAQHDLVIAIEDLVELEVAGGGHQAHAAAATLRARWRDDAAPTLARMRVESVDALVALRQRAEGAERVAEEREREAERLDDRARQLDNTCVPSEPERIAALEAELGDLDEAELTSELTRLGHDPITALRQRAAVLDKQFRECGSALDEQRDRHVRAEAQLESLGREAAVLEAAAEAQQAALGQPWSELAVGAEAAAMAARRELATLDDHLSMLARSGPAEERVARDAVVAREAELRSAEADMNECARIEQEARENLAAQLARVEAARARATEMDVAGTWTGEIRAGGMDLPLAPWRAMVEDTRGKSDDASRGLGEIRTRLTRLQEERARAIAQARAAVDDAGTAFDSARATVARLRDKEQKNRQELARVQQEVTADQIELARHDLGAIRAEVARLRGVLAGLEEPVDIDESEVAGRRQVASRLQDELEAKKEELAAARGALQQVGGAVVRERKADIEHALEHANVEWRAVETEYEGWKLLVETLREAESSESAHLGHALAAPVSQRFHQLTGGRYDALELGAHLEAEGLHAAGELRDVSVLSAGTQDQLATLLRLCIAERLRSSIVLDDHLSQSDPVRVAWFRHMLLDAAQEVQILFLTCRPLELLRPEEMPDGVAVRSSAAGILRAIDLSQVIRRHAPAGPPSVRVASDRRYAPEQPTP